MLTKIIVRALVSGPEPWKTFVRHRLANLAPTRDGDWGKSAGWLCSVSKAFSLGSGLWQTIWLAWFSIRKRLLKLKPEMHDEQLRQQLFLNPHITNTNDTPLEVDRRSKYRN